MLATRISNSPDAGRASVFADAYGLLAWAMVMRQKCMETGRKLPDEQQTKEVLIWWKQAKQRRKAMYMAGEPCKIFRLT